MLEALFAQDFSEEKPGVVLNRVLDSNPARKKSSEFIEILFFCVIENVIWADDLIKSHLQNWEFERVAQVDRLLLRMGICEIFSMYGVSTHIQILLIYFLFLDFGCHF